MNYIIVGSALGLFVVAYLVYNSTKEDTPTKLQPFTTFGYSVKNL